MDNRVEFSSEKLLSEFIKTIGLLGTTKTFQKTIDFWKQAQNEIIPLKKFETFIIKEIYKIYNCKPGQDNINKKTEVKICIISAYLLKKFLNYNNLKISFTLNKQPALIVGYIKKTKQLDTKGEYYTEIKNNILELEKKINDYINLFK